MGREYQEIFEKNGCTVIKDCYNAGPESMEAALKVLGKRAGRKIAVLGDMLELGSHSRDAHTKVGELASGYADVLLCYGAESVHMLQGAKNAGLTAAQHYMDQGQMARDLKALVRPGDVLLFKGSRGMKMENVLELFLQEEK